MLKKAAENQRGYSNKKLRSKEAYGGPTQLIDVPINVIPDSIHGLTEGLKPKQTTPKRRADANITATGGPAKKTLTSAQQSQSKTKDHATVGLSLAGFVEVHIQSPHCELIGKGCGVDTTDVRDALHADNAARMTDSTAPLTDEDAIEELDWEVYARFEPEFGDDLDMEEHI